MRLFFIVRQDFTRSLCQVFVLLGQLLNPIIFTYEIATIINQHMDKESDVIDIGIKLTCYCAQRNLHKEICRDELRAC